MLLTLLLGLADVFGISFGELELVLDEFLPLLLTLLMFGLDLLGDLVGLLFLLFLKKRLPLDSLGKFLIRSEEPFGELFISELFGLLELLLDFLESWSGGISVERLLEPLLDGQVFDRGIFGLDVNFDQDCWCDGCDLAHEVFGCEYVF
jgi:hypothetical protein